MSIISIIANIAIPRYVMRLIAAIPTISSVSVPRATSSKNCCGTRGRSSRSAPKISARR